MRRDRGFTLIELAIVLVIIGIIIGMVLKGQDLIQNARAKSFVNKTRHWETSVWIYFDRKGRFPGDSDKDGRIGDGNFKTDLINANLANPPYEGSSGSEINTITIGSYTFYVFFGTDGGTSDTGKNVMILCKDTSCSTFNNDDLIFVEAFDSAFDGTADGTAGQVICIASAPTVTAAEWEAVYDSGTVSAAACDTSARAIVYYFDAKRQ